MGDTGCDALQVLYEGSAESNIYAGWRDNMVDKAGYLILYLTEGLVIQEACRGSSGGDE